MKKLLLAFVLSLIGSQAWAVCSQIPLNVKDANNNTVAMSSASAGDGNCKTYIDADTASQIHTDLTAPLAAGANTIGNVNQAGTWTVQPGNTANTTPWLVTNSQTQVGQSLTNPTSTLTLTATTTAYTAGQLIANNATAGSVTNSSFAIANTAGGVYIPRLRLSTNDATSTAWGGQTIQVDLWSASPTWTNGDRAAWSPATGTGAHLATYSCVMSAEYGDGAYAECGVSPGNLATVRLASGTTVYWSLQAKTGSGITGASKVFTLTAELSN